MKNPSVFIAIPSMEHWNASFGMSLINMVASMGKPLKGGGKIDRYSVFNTKGSILPKSRHQLVLAAMGSKCSHMLFLDSDMTFPSFTLHQLLAANVDVIATNCAVKRLPSAGTARHKTSEYSGKVINSSELSGVEQVWRVGTGVMLIKMDVFQRIKLPWFETRWNPAIDDFVGEDWAFCERLDDAGIPIYVDHTLSKHIGHIGAYTYEQKDIQLETNT